MRIVERSVTGNFRKNNEDTTAIILNGTNQQLLLVADGMGGHQHGEVASEFVRDKLVEAWKNTNLLRVNEAEKFMKNLIIQVNRELYDFSTTDDKYKGMGTTIVLAAFIEDTIIVLNIGDSRAYVLTARDVQQVTKDHSFVELLIDSGEITREDALKHPHRNVVTKAMGTNRLIQPDVFRLRNKQYHYLLLASDGLTDTLSKSEIHQEMFNSKPLEERAEALVNTALDNGSTDNVSIVIADLKASE
ncbi:Stp1/IreP family PP2C-type Ser/Thr phosphatase [Aliicoccus persicus]|uniref:Protein phosphatase n=1 Tax=Aliicoccus persicus TaxID=930138 RepID=A0A662Z259_9STAP|nr:Stp1/IreP family PP2C-type Ser/Thr phosphatase [Aliicoccus persicus]SEV81124.1 protein phosphatase [Aliicoccus persicus]